MTEKITCSGCDSVWTGVGRCHHAKEECHQTFGGRTTFDLHLRTTGNCIHPSELGLTQNEDGVWVGTYGTE